MANECENDDDAKKRYLREYEETEGKFSTKITLVEIQVYARSRNFASILFGENSVNELICLRPRS